MVCLGGWVAYRDRKATPLARSAEAGGSSPVIYAVHEGTITAKPSLPSIGVGGAG